MREARPPKGQVGKAPPPPRASGLGKEARPSDGRSRRLQLAGLEPGGQGRQDPDSQAATETANAQPHGHARCLVGPWLPGAGPAAVPPPQQGR